MKNYSFKKNQSFYIREGWLTKGLLSIKEYDGSHGRFFSKDNHGGADALGVGSAMAAAIRYWMRVCGLLCDHGKEAQTLTPFGRLVLQKDPYLENIGTLWMLHLNICMNYKDATMWSLFFNTVHIGLFDKYVMEKKIEDVFRKKEGITDDSQFSLKSFETDYQVLLHSYVCEEKEDDPEERLRCPLSELHLLSQKEGKYYKEKGQADKISAFVFLYGILLFLLHTEDVKEEMPERISFGIDELWQKENSPGKLLSLDRTQVNEFLDELERVGFVKVDRTSGLDTVYLKKEVFVQLNEEEGSAEEFEGKEKNDYEKFMIKVARRYYEIM